MTIDALDSLLEKISFDSLSVDNFEIEKNAIARVCMNIHPIRAMCLDLVIDNRRLPKLIDVQQ